MLGFDRFNQFLMYKENLGHDCTQDKSMDDKVKNVVAGYKRADYLLYMMRVGYFCYDKIAEFDVEYLPSKEPIPFADLKNHQFKPYSKSKSWSEEKFDCAWFHMTTKIDKVDGDIVAVIALGGEGCVYKNGEPKQGLTQIVGTSDIFQPYFGKQVVELEHLTYDNSGNFDIYVDAGLNAHTIAILPVGKAYVTKSHLAVRRQDMIDYFYDITTLHHYCNAIKGKEWYQIRADLMRAKMIAGVTFKPENVAKARQHLSKYFDGKNNSDFTISAVGHAHLDLAWLWPMRETVRKSFRTMGNQLTFANRHPEYVFGSSQPQQMEWIKQNNPVMFENLKDAVKRGQVEAQGVMWCEPDINIPSGESLIRQCYYGKDFFKREFDKTLDFLWVPDVFGYSASLPRILLGSGVDKFMTIKLSWNTVTKFPHHSFMWKGLGDGEILVHMPPEGDYNSSSSPIVALNIPKAYREKEVSKVALMPYGVGDGGGGPSEYNIEVLKRQAKCNLKQMPKVKLESAGDFFAKLEKEKSALPHYEGELYLQKHQGTYTSQSRTKRFMRKTEILLHNVEFLSTLAGLTGYEYPKSDLDRIWKSVLLHQFHDILPGSSINRVYQDTHRVFEQHTKDLLALQNLALAHINTDQKSVMNATSFERKGDIKIDDKWYSYNAKPYSSAKLEEFKDKTFVVSEDTIENALVKVRFDKTGQIVELLDKVNNVDSCKDGKALNTMRVYTDKNMIPYGAWDIDIEYYKKPSNLMKLVSSRTYIDGGRAVREQKFEYNKSVLNQKVYIDFARPVVTVDNDINWQEDLKMLRADFEPSVFSDTVTCDIQMGHISRVTTEKTKEEYAQFEICAHKWVDVSDNGYGFALLNDCKYGHRVKNGLISLNLLRSPVYPDKKCDRAEHKFTYALYPHKGNNIDSSLIQYGYQLNNDLVFSNSSFDSVVTSSNSDIIIENIMTTPDGHLAVRLYESKGKKLNSTTLELGFEYESVAESNLLYENAKDIQLGTLTFGDFEIKTLLFTLKTPIKVK